jgi:thiol-disulfide isomerase/thioredoxin
MTNLATQMASAGFVVSGGVVVYLTRRSRLAHRRRAIRRAASLGGVLICLIGVAGFVKASWPRRIVVSPPPTEEELSRPASDFQFHRVEDGAAAALVDFRGQVVLLNLWATWCVGCVEEFPTLSRLQAEWADSGLTVITLSYEARSTLRRFGRKHPVTALQGYVSDVNRLPEPFRRGFVGFPTTYVLDRRGYIRGYFLGPQSYDQFEAKIRPLLSTAEGG